MNYDFVTKRNGEVVKFNAEKIKIAILKAANNTKEFDEKIASILTNIVIEKIKMIKATSNEQDKISIEAIQDLVEKVLLNTEYKETAKEYIVYRDHRRKSREIQASFNINMINDYIDQNTWKVKENSNTSFSLQGLHNFMSNELSAQYWLNNIYPKDIGDAHKNGDMHIHDLGFLSAYCCGWSLEDLLKLGFTGVPGKTSSKPPKHLRSALGQLTNFSFTMQGECLSEDTEILTEDGWKLFINVSDNEKVKTLNKLTKQTEYQNILRKIEKDYNGYMYHFEGDNIDQMTTELHRAVIKNGDDIEIKSSFLVNKDSDCFIEENLTEAIIKNIEKFKYTGKVYCVEVPNGIILIKRNEKISWTGNCSGAQAVSNLDTLMAPFIRYDNLNYPQVRQAVQEFIFNMNVPTRAGFQNVFSNVSLDLKVPSTHKDMPVIYDGKYHETDTYGMFQHEMDMFNRAFCEVMIEGDASGRIFSFPIPTYSIDKDFDWDNKELDILWKTLGKYGIGYISNFVNSDMSPEDARSMCPLHKDTKVTIFMNDSNPSTGIEDTIENLYNGCKDKKFYVYFNNEFKEAKFIKVIAEKYVTITFDNDIKETLEYRHIQPILDYNKAEMVDILAKDLKVGMTIPFKDGFKNIINIEEFVANEDTKYAYCFEVEKDPYFSLSSDMVTHNCRLRIDNRELRKKGGGLFGASPLTGCYDEKTEVFTENGWKFFKDLTFNDKLFTVNKHNVIESHKPKKLFEYNWDGELIRFKAKSLDLLVTPNHRMFVENKYNQQQHFVQAQNFNPNIHYIPKYSFWLGNKQEFFILPGIEGDDKYPDKKIPMDIWVRFLGIYLSEGSSRARIQPKRTSYEVSIAQQKPHIRQKIKSLLSMMDFSFSETPKQFYIYNKQLALYLLRFGRQEKRFIPKEILNLSTEYLELLAQWLIFGDGYNRKEGIQIMYWTTSKQLASDVQELFLKLGKLSTITELENKNSIIRGAPVIARRTCYCVSLQTTSYYRLREHNISKEQYTGKVYCCEVENNVVLVKRNGKMSWCGNSIGVVTINLPRLGYISTNETDFINNLDDLLEKAKRSLLLKRKIVEDFADKGMYPYLSFYLKEVKERMKSYWTNHFNTVGIVGMNEACLNLLNCSIADKEGIEFATRVMDHIRARMIEFQEETGSLFNLEATPGESMSYSLALKDKKKYPNIRTAFDNDETPMYTNSTHLPVNFTNDIFELLDLQDELQTKYTGGTVVHLFLGEEITDVDIVKNLIRKVCNNYKLPYFSLTPTFSVCSDHGYITGKVENCPTCDKETEVFSRIVGYYRPTKSWNTGKQLEFNNRKTFKI